MLDCHSLSAVIHCGASSRRCPAQARAGQSSTGAPRQQSQERPLVETKIAAAGGERRRVGFYSAARREVPIRMFNDWHDSPPGFCEIDMVAHGGTSLAGSSIQTSTSRLARPSACRW